MNLRSAVLLVAALAPAFAFCQTEGNWELRRKLKGLAEADYLDGYLRVRAVAGVRVFWELHTSSKTPPKVRGVPKPGLWQLKVWVWNNTDRPLRLEPSSFRFVDSGREYFRNSEAVAGRHPMKTTIIPARTIYVGEMVANAPTGKRFEDEYALEYTSPQPEETFVVQRYIYWKNSIDAEELARSYDKALYVSKDSGGYMDKPRVPWKHAVELLEFEADFSASGTVPIPKDLYGHARRPKVQDIPPKPVSDEPQPQPQPGFLRGTTHARGDVPPVILAAPSSSLAEGALITGIRLKGNERFFDVRTWTDVALFLKAKRPDEAVVRGRLRDGQAFEVGVDVDEDVVGSLP